VQLLTPHIIICRPLVGAFSDRKRNLVAQRPEGLLAAISFASPSKHKEPYHGLACHTSPGFNSRALDDGLTLGRYGLDMDAAVCGAPCYIAQQESPVACISCQRCACIHQLASRVLTTAAAAAIGSGNRGHASPVASKLKHHVQ